MICPTFTVAGVARGGTSAVCEMIRSHPQGFVTRPKEPHYYAFSGERPSFTGPGDDKGINRNAVTDRQDFVSLFAEAGGFSARGDGSVSSFYYPRSSVPAMLEINQAMKVVVVLRHPVERAFSSWQYMRMRGAEDLASFTQALAAEDERVRQGWHHLWHYRRMSLYASSMETFVEAFPRGQLHVVLYDDLVERPLPTSEELLRFLELDPGQVEDATPPLINRSGQPRSLALLRLVNRARRVPAIRSIVRSAVPFQMREKARNLNLRDERTVVQGRAQLVEQFRPDLERVESLLGRELPPRWFS